MSYREHAPHPALAPFVDRLWTTDARGDGAPRLVLPDGCVDVLVPCAHADAPFVVGAMTRAAVIEGPAAAIVAVRFRPGGAAPFLRRPVAELTDRHDADVPWLRIDPRAPVRSLERALLARLRAVDARVSGDVAHAVARLAASDAPPIATLARELGVTRQHLARRFVEHVGVTPKQLSRIARMQRAVGLLGHDGGGALADVALRAGYFDQAHLARDLRELATLTPAEVSRAGGSIRPIRSLYPAPP